MEKAEAPITTNPKENSISKLEYKVFQREGVLYEKMIDVMRVVIHAYTELIWFSVNQKSMRYNRSLTISQLPGVLQKNLGSLCVPNFKIDSELTVRIFASPLLLISSRINPP